jgi:hypothetical protein
MFETINRTKSYDTMLFSIHIYILMIMLNYKLGTVRT